MFSSREIYFFTHGVKIRIVHVAECRKHNAKETCQFTFHRPTILSRITGVTLVLTLTGLELIVEACNIDVVLISTSRNARLPLGIKY